MNLNRVPTEEELAFLRVIGVPVVAILVLFILQYIIHLNESRCKVPGAWCGEDCKWCEFNERWCFAKRCEFCSVLGRKGPGPHHDFHCCRYDQRACSHCGLRGSFDFISSESSQHGEGCPPRPAVCNGCGIHKSFTVLTAEADSKWTDAGGIGAELWVRPQRLKFCQDSISRNFYDGTSVFKPRHGIPKISACFHWESDGLRLFALNNRTLFNAMYTDVSTVLVSIVEKPDDWLRRFTGRRPWMCMKVRGPTCTPDALRIPATAFPGPGGGQQSICLVVLEVRNLVNAKTETFLNLLKDMSSDLDARHVEGPRSFARVRVNESDVPLVRSMVKALAERKGKNVRTVDCIEVQGMRRYESPRD